MNPHGGTSGVDWDQAGGVFKVLLISPLVGFGLAAILLLLLKALCQESRPLSGSRKAPSRRPSGFARSSSSPAPASASVTAPTTAKKAWASSCSSSSAPSPPPTRSTTPSASARSQNFAAVSAAGRDRSSTTTSRPNAVIGDARTDLTDYIRTKEFNQNTMLAAPPDGRGDRQRSRRSTNPSTSVPANQQQNVRNDMYVVSEALRLIAENPARTARPPSPPPTTRPSAHYKKQLDNATKFIPTWVKVAVAIALGLGTMVGWKRIVVTVGEKIGKSTSPTPRAPPLKSSPPSPSSAPISSTCPSPPPTSSPPAWPAP